VETSLGRIAENDYIAFGSFTSLTAAGRLINSTLASNQQIVDRVVATEAQRKDALRRAVIKKTFDQPTGYESYLPSPNGQFKIRPTYSVRVIIRHDERVKDGYLILTGFPFNR